MKSWEAFLEVYCYAIATLVAVGSSAVWFIFLWWMVLSVFLR